MSLKFNPVQCTFDTFEKMSPNDGYVYFVTDKKQIYLGKGNEKIPMGASSGIYYGIKEVAYDNSGMTPNPNVFFATHDIQVSSKGVPEKDDLILNIGTEAIPDGCFYRINAVKPDGYDTVRLTLQGGGGGGSNIPGGGGSTNASFGIEIVGGETRYFAKNGTEADLNIIAHSEDLTNYITKIECSFSQDNTDEDAKFHIMENLGYQMEENISIPIVQHLSKFNTSGSNIVYVHVYDKYSSSRWTRFTIHVIELEISTNLPTMLSSITDSFDFRVSLSGSLALRNYAVNFEYYNDDGDMVFNEAIPIESNQIGTSNYPCLLNLSNLSHGAYTLKVYLTGLAGINTIPSNILTHKIIRYREGGDPILGVLIPDYCEQYTAIPINYLLVYGDSVKNYDLSITLDNDEIAVESVSSGILDTYDLTVDIASVYRLKLAVEELSILLDYELTVNPYNGILPVINIARNDLEVYLNPRGRTNNSTTKTQWFDTKNKARYATLDGFHFRTVDGWLKDSNGVDYLKVSQGANVSFTAFSPLSKNPKTNGLTIELDFMLTGISNYSTPLIDCISYTSAGTINTGFRITGDKFNYYIGGNSVVSLNLVQDKRIRISFVIEPTHQLCYTYLDGIVSHVHQYGENDILSSTTDQPANLFITSTVGQINIYGIRFYSSGLSAQTVVSNYQASLDTLALREESFLSNQIRNLQGAIDIKKLQASDYKLNIPYVKLVGGYSILKDEATGNMIMAAETTGNVPALPTTKKDYRAINMSVHYPTPAQNPYFANYSDFEITSEFGDTGLDVTNAFGQTLTKGAWMYGQGTSSMEYPVKNLRVKMKGGKIKVQPDLEAVNLICFKADYMESSGSHNTGGANFIDNVAYKSIGLTTPAQRHFDKINLVTCIKGHPCVIFWSPTGEEGSFTYIGKYNLNLDKATPEPFGFRHDDADPYFGHLVNEQGKLIDATNKVLTEEEIAEKTKLVNSIFCFEFLDNNAAVCNFRCDDESKVEIPDGSPIPEGFETLENARYKNTWYNANGRKNEDQELVDAGWMRGFESRHPEDKTAVHDADALYPFASWINNLYGLKEAGKKAQADQRFIDEYWKYLDTDFLISYYVITEALLMADSRVKNMMIATWGKEHRYLWSNGVITNENKAPDTGVTLVDSHFGYIWYPIFYDMDTMLGLDNIGRRNKNYYDEDTNEDVFNGDEVLWNFVRDNLQAEITTYYRRYEEGNALRKDYLLPCFNLNQANMANETFYNEDAAYKYIDPYLSHASGVKIAAAQGNRSLDREFFIENRLKYLAGKYASEDHVEKDRFFFRLTYPKHIENPKDEGERKHNESIKAENVPPSNIFVLKSAKTCYGSVKVGNVTSGSLKFINEQTHTIKNVDTSSANGTEVYITGITSMADVGDLSNKYPYGIDTNGMRGSAVKSLKLGNHNQHYYNKYFDDTSIDFSPLAYLEEVNIENCGACAATIHFEPREEYKTIDHTGKEKIIPATPGCSKLKKFVATGSIIGSPVFPVGGVMEELRLPTTVTSLKLDSHGTLNDGSNIYGKPGFTLGKFNYTTNTYENDFSKLIMLYIKNTNINTYNIVKGNYDTTKTLTNYYIEGFDWTLSQASDFEIVDGRIVGIPVLDFLSQKTPEGVNDKAMALLGTLTINLTGYKINEYNIYHKYQALYPNVEIKYSNAVTQQDTYFEPAIKMYFYRVDAAEAPEDIRAREPYYFTITDGKDNWGTIVGNKDFVLPTKMSSNTKDYTFAGVWLDWNNNKVEINHNNMDYVPTTPADDKEMHLVPKYTVTDRVYTIKFYDYDGSELEDYLVEGHYNDNVGTLVAENGKYYYRYRSEEGLGTNLRYAFRGWRSEQDHDNNIAPTTPINLNTLSITKNIKLYAYYDIENVTVTASDEYLFQLAAERRTINGLPIDGCVIDLKPMFAQLVRGKITIPATFNGVNVIALGSLNAASNLNELYFASNNITYLADSSCRDCYSLTKVQLPTSLVEIGQQAFNQDSALKTINLLDTKVTTLGQDAFAYNTALELSRLPDTLIYIGVRAFHECRNITISDIPQSVTVIREQGFMGCSKVNVSELGKGQPLEVGYRAFSYTGKFASSTESIKINSPVIFTKNSDNEMGVFVESFTSNLKDLYTYSSFGYDGNDSALVADLFGPLVDGITVHILK